MAVNLVDLVKGYLTPDIVQNVAAYVGESNAATQKALGGVVPALIGGLATMGSTSSGAQELTRILDAGKYDGGALDNVAGMFSGGSDTKSAVTAGKGILESLFGARIGGVTDLLTRFAGVRGDSAYSLLALVAPLVLNVLGRQRAKVGASPSALMSLLGDQKSIVANLLPAGLGSLLGWSGFSDLGSSVTGAASRVTREVAQAPQVARRIGWVLPLVILAGLALAILAWLSTWQTAPVREAARRVTELQLPGGLKISVPDGSFNFAVARWLSSSTDTTVPKRFVFEDLNFETGSTRLTSESAPTVDSLVAILKAYPAVSVALEGYTDSTGDPAANKQLSLDRAAAVKEMIVKGGIDGSRIATAGYGQEKPIASNDTEEGRAKNRRLELVVQKR